MWQYTALVWPFMLFGLCYIIWNWISVWWSNRRDTPDHGMDSAEISEENPWHAN